VKRLLLALVPLAVVVSGCAVGEPQPPTAPSATGITLNANLYSSLDGPADYWFKYRKASTTSWSETPHRSVNLTRSVDENDKHPQSVSEPITGLQPDTTYDWQICVADREENPPRDVCSKTQAFGTVGDTVQGLTGVFSSSGDPIGDASFDARSGPKGENPAGTVTTKPTGVNETPTYSVGCLRVDGTHAVIGLGSPGQGPFPIQSFLYLNVPADPLATATAYQETGNGSNDCPAYIDHSNPDRLTNHPTIHDAP
jgi:hypothetical protein